MVTLVSTAAVLQLVVASTAALADVSMDVVAREIRAIWAPYVEVVVTTGHHAPPGVEHTLELRTHVDRPIAGTQESDALAWIDFVDGEPQPAITVSPALARRLAGQVTVLGQPARRLPPSLSRKFTSIAVARAVAHEIGHYVLRSKRHAATGLMRARLRPEDLLTRPSAIRLTAADAHAVLERFAPVLSAGARSDPTLRAAPAGDAVATGSVLATPLSVQ